MKEPTTPDEVKAFHKLLRSDAQRCLQIVNGWIAENPTNSHAYFDRYLVWMKIGEPRRALPSRFQFGRAARYTGISVNMRRHCRTFNAVRRSIPRNGKTMGSAFSSRPIATPA